MRPRSDLAGAPVARPVVLAAAVVALDQASKRAVVETLGPNRPEHELALVGSVVSLEYAENRGAAFGLFAGGNAILALVAVVVLGGLAVFYRRQVAPSAPLVVAVGLIAGGALGNLVDRLRLGYVVDFVAVGPWPNFNLADSAITIGVGLLGMHALRDDPPQAAGTPRGASADTEAPATNREG